MDYKLLSLNKSNLYIKNKLKRNEVFNLTRIGYAELQYLYWKYVNILNIEYYRKKFSDIKYNYRLNKFSIHTLPYDADTYKTGLKSGTLQAVWEDKLGKQYRLFNKLSIRPEAIVNAKVLGLPTSKNADHWSDGLKSKKLLIVSPFQHNILKEQHAISNKLWTTINNPLYQTELECVTTPMGFSSKSQYIGIIKSLKEKINNSSFDIALIGCSVLGLPLNKYIHQIMGKTAIYVGGSLQLYFGIYGKRWEYYNNIIANRNSYWINNPIPMQPDYIVLDNNTYW